MRKLYILILSALAVCSVNAQNISGLPQTRIMTLGVFHFAYPNLDAVKTLEKDQISVFDEPYHSQIIAIASCISQFRPTIIAVEITPDAQSWLDSLYAEYKADKFDLLKGEVYQLGFRIGKACDVPVIHCVNDWGRHYSNIEALIQDSLRLAEFENYLANSADSLYFQKETPGKIKDIVKELITLNDPVQIHERLSVYLCKPFKYEEQPGDFTGVDFETGRWFNCNLRIFRNIQRIPHHADDRILLIIGREHLNLLNLFFEVSKEFKLASPLPFLINAGNN